MSIQSTTLVAFSLIPSIILAQSNLPSPIAELLNYAEVIHISTDQLEKLVQSDLMTQNEELFYPEEYLNRRAEYRRMNDFERQRSHDDFVRRIQNSVSLEKQIFNKELALKFGLSVRVGRYDFDEESFTLYPYNQIVEDPDNKVWDYLETNGASDSLFRDSSTSQAPGTRMKINFDWHPLNESINISTDQAENFEESIVGANRRAYATLIGRITEYTSENEDRDDEKKMINISVPIEVECYILSSDSIPYAANTTYTYNVGENSNELCNSYFDNLRNGMGGYPLVEKLEQLWNYEW